MIKPLFYESGTFFTRFLCCEKVGGGVTQLVLLAWWWCDKAFVL